MAYPQMSRASYLSRLLSLVCKIPAPLISRDLLLEQAKISIYAPGGFNAVSQQTFQGGSFQGCSFGDNNSLTNYGVVDNLGTVEEDVKQKLKEARGAIERADLSDADKADVVDELNKLTAELEKPEKDEGRVKRYWNHIKGVAPTVASILASAASLAKLLGGG
jgi:hypothetical protein